MEKQKEKDWEESLKKENQVVSKPTVQWLRYKDGMMVLQMLTASGHYVEVPVIDVDEPFRKTQ